MIRIREAPWVDPSAFGYLVSNNPTRIMADTADIIFDQEETQVRPSYHSTMSSQGSKAEGKRVIPLIPKSKVWRHYRDCFDGEHVTCKLCTDQGKQTKYKVCDGSTGTIRDHIEKKHPAEFKDIKAEETKEKAESKENKNKRAKLEANQPTLKDTINKFTKVDPQGAQQKQFDKLLLHMIGCNFMAFSFIDSPEFHDFINFLNKTFNVKTGRTYRKQMTKVAEDMMMEVRRMLKEFCRVGLAVTTDIWTSRTQESYISLTCHFIDEHFRLHCWTPACRLFDDNHTGDNITRELEDLVSNKLEMSNSLPLFATSDNASNMRKGIGQSRFEFYSCSNHTQQLAILDTFKEFEGLSGAGVTLLDASNTCKALASHLHKSALSKLMLEKECEESKHVYRVIPQSNETRWDSRYYTMEATTYHQDCLLRLARKGKFKVKRDKQVVSLVPSMEEFELLNAGVKVLKVCQQTTKVMEQEVVPTLPLVVERLYNMDKELEELEEEGQEEVVIDFCTKIRMNLQADNRFPNFGMENPLNCMANYLNPYLQGCHLRLQGRRKFDETKEMMEEKLKEWKDSTEKEVEVELEENVDEPEEVEVKKLTFTERLRKEQKKAEEKKNPRKRKSRVFEEPETPLEKEMKKYEAIEVEYSKDMNILLWWKLHSKEFPLLSFLVRVVFAIPAASSKSERVFSVAGRIVTPDRNRMAPEMVESLVMIKCNLRLLKNFPSI